MRSKTILVTGGAGFIGSNLISFLLKFGYEIILIDNFNDFYDPKIKEINIKDFKDQVIIYKVDVRDSNKILDIFNNHKIDLVIHLAAYAGVRTSFDNPSLYNEVNCLGLENILNAMVKYNTKKIIFASSSSVYGNSKEIPFKEDSILEPLSPYAETKCICEKLIENFHNKYKTNALILRFFSVYGPRQRPDLVINKFINKILNNEVIDIYGDGFSARDYTHIDDILDGINKSISYLDENDDVCELVNIGSSNPIKIKTLVSTLCNELDMKCNIVYKQKINGEPDITYASIAKAKFLLNYGPKVSFEEGVKKYVRWYKDNIR